MLYGMVALIAVVIIALDQISKSLIVSALVTEGAERDLIPGILRFTYVRNGNGMMGLFGEIRWVFLVFSAIIVAALIVYLWRARPKNPLLCTSLAFLIGGGVGNLVDRALQADGKVVDFIDFYAFPNLWHYIFNVADIFVCVGVGLVILYLILDTAKTVKAEKQAKAEEVSHDQGKPDAGA